MSMEPHFSRTAAANPSHSDRCVTSSLRYMTLPPPFSITPARSASLSVRRAPMATLAPALERASAVASPIPLLAPVTMATLSFIIRGRRAAGG